MIATLITPRARYLIHDVRVHIMVSPGVVDHIHVSMSDVVVFVIVGMAPFSSVLRLSLPPSVFHAFPCEFMVAYSKVLQTCCLQTQPPS